MTGYELKALVNSMSPEQLSKKLVIELSEMTWYGNPDVLCLQEEADYVGIKDNGWASTPQFNTPLTVRA